MGTKPDKPVTDLLGFVQGFDAFGASGDFFPGGKSGRLQIGILLPFGGRVEFCSSQPDARPGHHSSFLANLADF